MKRTVTFTISLALAALLLAATYKQDPIIAVTSTTTATLTDLAGTQATWNQLIVHNRGTVPVGYCLESADDGCTAMTNFATRKGEIPPNAAIEITDRDVAKFKHAAESGTADLVIERVRKVR